MGVDRSARTMANSLLTCQQNMSQTFMECSQNIANMGLEAADLHAKQVSRAMIVAMDDFNANNARMAEGVNNTLAEVLQRSELKADQVVSMLNARGGEFADIARSFQTSLEKRSEEWRTTVTMLGSAFVFPLILMSVAAFMPETDKQDLSLTLKLLLWRLSDKTFSTIDIVALIAYTSGIIWLGRAFIYLMEMWKIQAHNLELTSYKAQMLEHTIILEKARANEMSARLINDMLEIKDNLEASMAEQRTLFEGMRSNLSDQDGAIRVTVEEIDARFRKDIHRLRAATDTVWGTVQTHHGMPNFPLDLKEYQG